MRKSKKLVRGLSMAMAASMIVSSSGMPALAAAESAVPGVTVEAEMDTTKENQDTEVQEEEEQSSEEQTEKDQVVEEQTEEDTEAPDEEAQVQTASEIIDEKSDNLGNLRAANADVAVIQNTINNLIGTVDVQLTGTKNLPTELLADVLKKVSDIGYGSFEFDDPTTALTTAATTVDISFVSGFAPTKDGFSVDGDKVDDTTGFTISVNVKGVNLTASDLSSKFAAVDGYGFVTQLTDSGNETSTLLGSDISALEGKLNTALGVASGFTLAFQKGDAVIEENTKSVPVVVTFADPAKDYYAAGSDWTVNEDKSITTVINVPITVNKANVKVTDDMVLDELKTNLGLSTGISKANISLGEATYDINASTVEDYFTLPTSKYGTWEFDSPAKVGVADTTAAIKFTYDVQLNDKGYESAVSSAVTSAFNAKIKINKYEIKRGVDYQLPTGYDKDTAVFGNTLGDVTRTYSDSSYDESANDYVTIDWESTAKAADLELGTKEYPYEINLKDKANVKFADEEDTVEKLSKTMSITVANPTAVVKVAGAANTSQGTDVTLTANADVSTGDIAANSSDWTVAYKWYKVVNGNKTEISGATAKTYKASAAVLGKTTYVCDVTLEYKGSSTDAYGAFDGKTVYTSNEAVVNVSAISFTGLTSNMSGGTALTYNSIDTNAAKLEATFELGDSSVDVGYKAGTYEWSYKKTKDSGNAPIADSKSVIIKNGTIPEDGKLTCNVPIDLTAGTYEFVVSANASNGTLTDDTVSAPITVEVKKAEIKTPAFPSAKAAAAYGQTLADVEFDLDTVSSADVKNNGKFTWQDEKTELNTVGENQPMTAVYTLNDPENYEITGNVSSKTGTVNVTVNKADLVFTAKNIEITTADKLPETEAAVEGLVGKDTLTKLGIVVNAEYAQDVDTTKPGTYDIAVKLTNNIGDEVKETDNYNLKTVNGTLTVKAVEVTEIKLNKSSMEFDTIGAADALKATVAPDNAVDKTVTYTSSNTNAATVDADGIVRAVGNGTAVITAKAGNATAACNVKVSQKASQITISDNAVTFNKVGDTKKLTVSAAPSNADLSIAKWSSSNSNVASVDAGGTVKAVADGTAVITVEVGNVKATSTITVVTKTTGLTLSTSSVVFDKIGDTRTVTASVTPANSSSVTWSTSNGNVATVSAGGVITAIGNGTAVITAKAGDISKTVNVTVNQKATGLTLSTSKVSFDKIGATKTVTASVTPANSANVAWSTSNSKVATVSASGVIKAVGNGTATITAKAGDLTKTVSVKVSQKTSKVSITYKKTTVSGTVKVTKGKSYNFDSVVTPTNASKENAKVTWKTSNKKIATVSSTGTVKVKGKGTVTITATTADGKKASVKLKASTATVKATKVKVTGSKTMKVKGKQTLKVTVSPVTVSNSKVKWTTSNKKIATVNSKGVVTARKAGTVKITATSRDGSGKKSTITIKIKK